MSGARAEQDLADYRAEFRRVWGPTGKPTEDAVKTFLASNAAERQVRIERVGEAARAIRDALKGVR